MSNEIAITKSNQMFLSMIERVATNPEMDVAKLEKILEMQERIFDKNAEIEFNAAMSRAQSKIEPVARDADNSQTSSKYSRLETICEKVTPVYTEEGFALSFDTAECPTEGWLRIICDVSHRSGHNKIKHLDLPPDNAGIKGNVNKTMLQGLGSTISYGRRYLTLMIFNVTMKGEDNDGNSSQNGKPMSKEAPLINETQLKTLKAAMDKAGVNDLQFCKIAGIQSISDLQQPRLAGALKRLKNMHTNDV